MPVSQEMVELKDITETLRRQRADLDELVDETLSRSSQTAELLGKIEELRARSEKTQRAIQPKPAESRSPRK